ncbi:MAG TPA: cupin [Cytophagales bacterium]|jgi:quercetin dioxygenase-like cupin family protein|nr:cupin [Cytophagales bacterium]|tara:strand:+ start:852 stop:1184 length:333 start_codon:yes stop_codon:yes gene_type:complete
MKVNVDDISGTLVKDNETYVVFDNTTLNKLILSKTILYPEKSTTGHKHPGQEEIYHFVHGHGTIEVDALTQEVSPGSIVLINDGAFHRVHNVSSYENLVFVCIFDGKRDH